MTQAAQHWVRLRSEDLEVFCRLRDPLRTWLLESHGRRGLREGTIGLASALSGLVGLHAFGWSPLLVMLHIVVALCAEGIGAVVETRRSPGASAKPFLSPAHALAFARGTVEAFARPLLHEHHGCVPADRMPHARTAQGAAARHSQRPASAASPALRREQPAHFAIKLFGWLLLAAAGLLSFVALGVWLWTYVTPLALLFDGSQWLGLTVFAILNALHGWSLWQASTASLPDEPWQHRWFIGETPSLGQLGWWNHDKRMGVFAAWILMIFMFILTGPAATDAPAMGAAYAARFEARLAPVLSVFLLGSALLHLLLLAAPWQARKWVGVIDAFDPNRAQSLHRRQRAPAAQGAGSASDAGRR